jgi:N-acyl-D-aspartate/D-glutamate deacylase
LIESQLGVWIRGGTVIDGTGQAPFRGDVWVEGDRISEVVIGDKAGRASDRRPGLEIDAVGKVVCPGFIDVHSHDDLAVIRTPLLPFKVSQGITSVIVGNCGIGAAPTSDALIAELKGGPGHRSAALGPVEDVSWRTFDEYLGAVEKAASAVNVAALAGHNTIRSAVCGEEERAVSAAELDRMAGELAGAMESGAVGLSTGLIYAPGRAAGIDELAELASVAASAGGLYASHMRDEADHVHESVEEALEIGRRSGCHVHISHLKAAGRKNWGSVPQILEQLATADSATVDVYPYRAASTFLREALAATGESPLLPSEVVISSCPGFVDAEGMTLEQLGEKWGLDQAKTVERLYEMSPTGITSVYFAMSDADVEAVLRFDRAMIGTDGIPYGSRPHPRLFGTFPRVFGQYCRDRGFPDLVDAVRRATSLAADTFGLDNRGRIQPSRFADLVVFDPTTIEDVATYTEPNRFARGIDYVITNGRVVWHGGTPSGARPGRVLRRQPNRDHLVASRAS